MVSAHYLKEVLGVTNYICPSAIHELRHLKGGLPCRFLIIVFNELSPSEKMLLKKIMSSIEVFKYSVLEVKEEKILDELFERADKFSQFVCIFSGKNFIQEGKLIQKEGRLISALGDNSTCSFFQSAYSLEELEEKSVAVREKKQELWQKLKQWKSLNQF